MGKCDQNVTNCDNILQNVATCTRLKHNITKCEDLWPLCENPVCPDPVWKPVTGEAGPKTPATRRISVAATSRGERSHTRNRHLRNRGFSVAFSNRLKAVASPNRTSLFSGSFRRIVTFPADFSNGLFQWMFSGIFQQNFTSAIFRRAIFRPEQKAHPSGSLT